MSEGNTGESWRDKLNSKFSEIYAQYSIRPKIASSREKINSFIADAEDSTEKATVTVKNKPKEWLFTTSEFVNTNPFFKYTAIAARNYEAQFLVFYTVFGAAFSYSKCRHILTWKLVGIHCDSSQLLFYCCRIHSQIFGGGHCVFVSVRQGLRVCVPVQVAPP